MNGQRNKAKLLLFPPDNIFYPPPHNVFIVVICSMMSLGKETFCLDISLQ